jgi:hypothetical protein
VGEASGSSESEDKSVAMDTENREEEGGNAAGSSWKKRKKSNDDLRIPGQLSSEAPPLDYHAKKKAVIAHITTLIGKSFNVKHKNKSMIWTVVEEWIP